MRPISAALQTVQLVRSPRARVTITVEARGQSEGVPALAWSELVSNSGQSSWKQVALCSRSDGQVLRFVSETTGVEQQRIADPTIAANWATPTATTAPRTFWSGVIPSSSVTVAMPPPNMRMQDHVECMVTPSLTGWSSGFSRSCPPKGGTPTRRFGCDTALGT